MYVHVELCCSQRGVGESVGEGQSGREVDFFFKFTFMNTKRRAVSSTHAKAQIAARPASSRLGWPDTKRHLAI